jgi:hypothetical protein
MEIQSIEREERKDSHRRSEEEERERERVEI